MQPFRLEVGGMIIRRGEDGFDEFGDVIEGLCMYTYTLSSPRTKNPLMHRCVSSRPGGSKDLGMKRFISPIGGSSTKLKPQHG